MRSRALLVPVPPSRAASRNVAPAELGRPDAVRTGTRWAGTAVPPAPPAKSFPGPPPARRPGKPLVPYRTTVGRPRRTCQPGIVTASHPCADAAPASALPLATRLVPGRADAAGRAGRAVRVVVPAAEAEARWTADPAGTAAIKAGPVTASAAIVIPVASRSIPPITPALARHLSDDSVRTWHKRVTLVHHVPSRRASGR